MQKIILKNGIGYNFNSIRNVLIYLGTLSVAAFVCYCYTSPLITLQALINWAIIYNTALLIFGTPPKIDNIYFLEVKGENHFYPLLDGTHQKFSLITESFVFLVSNRIKYALYLASCLYCIFVILMFCTIFRLDFVYQFSTIFGLDYFYGFV